MTEERSLGRRRVWEIKRETQGQRPLKILRAPEKEYGDAVAQPPLQHTHMPQTIDGEKEEAEEEPERGCKEETKKRQCRRRTSLP